MDATAKIIEFLLKHDDPTVVTAGEALKAIEAGREITMASINTGLDNIRMDMQYLMFDLEATRRERDELKEAGE